MTTTWIVLANASRARVFEARDDGAAPAEVLDLTHPESRLHGAELGSSRAGHGERHGPDGSQGGTAYPPRTDPRDKAHEAFARELAQRLREALAGARCERLVLAASSPFLGALRAALDPATAAAVVRSEAVDLTTLAAPALRARLQELIVASPSP